ncbi:MAG: phospholipase [Gracilibacter sp. BRH_c7a]|nr:MAG: phospholipase [Gracilibacter sp. BRH_c7a]
MVGENGRNALVVEGGAMRGIFSTGVLDAFLEKNFNPFDICIGVSAGASNLASYLAGMYQRNYKVYTDYSVRPDFINWRKFIRGGHLVDLDWLWDITIKEIRLDLDKIINTDKEYLIGVTDVSSGKALYLKPERNNLEDMLKASSSIPVFYREFVQLEKTDFVDGALVDPIPVIEAYNRKAVNIMVIRSRPHSYTMKAGWQDSMSKLYLRKYPRLIEAIMNRPRKYQEALDFMRNPPSGIRILEVNPPSSFRTKRLTTDRSALEQDYGSGYEAGRDLVNQW